MSDNQQKIPSFNEIMQKPTQQRGVPSFEDIMGDELPKKKGLGSIAGQVLSKAGGTPGKSNAPSVVRSEKERLAEFVYNLKTPEEKKQSKPTAIVNTTKPFKKEERPFDETQDEYKVGMERVLTDISGQKDPLGYSQTQANKKYSDNTKEAIHYGTAESLIKENVDDLQGAKEWLYSNDKTFDPDNKTDVAARDRIHEYEKTKNIINKNYGNIPRTAMEMFSDDDRIKTLRESGLMPDKKTEGLIIQKFLNDRNVKEFSRNNAEFHNTYKEQEDNFRTNYPELWGNQILQKIAQGREDYGYNNPFLNLVGAKSSGTVIENLFMRGEIDEWDKKHYYEKVRPLLKLHMKSIPTTGILEKAFQSAIHGAEGIPKGVWDLTGLDKTLTTPEERAARDLAEESDYVGVTPKGIVNKISHATGNLAGVLLPMGLAAKGLTAAKLIKNPKAANELAMGLTFYHDLYKEAEKNNPEGGYLNQIQAVLQSAVFAKIAPAFGELSKGIIKQTTPAIKDILGKLETDAITANAAKEQITKTVLDKISQVGKSSVTTSSQMAIAEGVNDVIGGVFSGKFDADQTAQDMVSTFEHMMLGTPLLGMLHARATRDMSSELLEEMANRPDYYRSQIETLAKSDPEFAKKAPQLLENLDHLTQVKEALDEREDLKPEQKKKYQVLSLAEKILTDKSESIPDKGLKPGKQLAEIEIEKKKVLGEIGNKEFIEELYDEDLIPKADRVHLENNETGKFEPNKVGEYLKYLAQQDNNLSADWVPHKDKAPDMSQYPQELLAEANKRWAKEIEAAKPKEEAVSIDHNRELDLGGDQGVVGETKWETEVVTTPTESKQLGSIEDQKNDIEKRRQEEKDKYDIGKGGTLPIEGYEKTYADIDAKYDAELKALETKPQSNEQAIKPKGEEVSGEARQKIQAEEANKQAEKKAELESQRDAEILREKMPEMKDVNEVVPSVEEVDAGSKDSVELSRNKKMRQNLKNKYSELKKLFECLTK